MSIVPKGGESGVVDGPLLFFFETSTSFFSFAASQTAGRSISFHDVRKQLKFIKNAPMTFAFRSVALLCVSTLLLVEVSAAQAPGTGVAPSPTRQPFLAAGTYDVTISFNKSIVSDAQFAQDIALQAAIPSECLTFSVPWPASWGVRWTGLLRVDAAAATAAPVTDDSFALAQRIVQSLTLDSGVARSYSLTKVSLGYVPVSIPPNTAIADSHEGAFVAFGIVGTLLALAQIGYGVYHHFTWTLVPLLHHDGDDD